MGFGFSKSQSKKRKSDAAGVL